MTMDVQKEVDKLVKKWWVDELRDKDKYARYAEYMSEDILARQEKLMWRSRQFDVFGKDWFYVPVLHCIWQGRPNYGGYRQ